MKLNCELSFLYYNQTAFTCTPVSEDTMHDSHYSMLNQSFCCISDKAAVSVVFNYKWHQMSWTEIFSVPQS